MEQDRLISATQAKVIIEERLNRKISQSKVSRLLAQGKFPSQPSAFDARKRLIRLSDLEKWLEQAEEEFKLAA